MRRYASWAYALAVATTACGFALEASAQVVDMTNGRLDRCAMHRELARPGQVPTDCRASGKDDLRGKVKVGGQQPSTPGAAPAPTAPGGKAPTAPAGQAPAAPPQTVDRPPPSREKPYGVALPIPFDFDSDRLTATGRRAVDQLAEVFKLTGQDKFIIQGHTDGRGGEDYNKDLSQRRAQAVADYLVEKHGISRDRLETQGLGKSSLLLPADPNNGRNRRVQVLNVGG
jgi:outer membrane protein OmpA-like peptidoglycan-associated protein